MPSTKILFAFIGSFSGLHMYLQHIVCVDSWDAGWIGSCFVFSLFSPSKEFVAMNLSSSFYEFVNIFSMRNES